MSSVWEDGIARDYADVRTAMPAAARARWIDALRAARPSMPVHRALDLGCGTGRFTGVLHEAFGATVIGVDGSPAMLRERSVTAGALAFLAAEANALPVRAAAVDLALLSMVYHLLAPATPAVRELHRVVRPGGSVMVRTPTRERLDTVPFLRFFPEARAIDEARIPAGATLVRTFAAAGFALHHHATIEQEFAATPAEGLEKIRRRPFSALRLITDAAFASGLARYEAHCRQAPATPLTEVLDLYVFRRNAPISNPTTRESG
jgi:ubiquinone/menaquinone biosynthesis C-methylase UbiE